MHKKQGRIQPVRLGGAISVVFGSQLALRVHYWKSNEVYFTTLLWQNNVRQNGLISRMLFSELYKVMVNKVTFVSECFHIKPSQVETLALKENGTHDGPRLEKLMRFFSICFTFFQKWKCFRKENKFVCKTKLFSFRSRLRNESVFETKLKLFLKRKDFNLQTKVAVFPKRIWNIFETKRF